ncbi:NAD(P)/FAD-dependent oxidoreductase [Limisalsivibrio acetivorans]|uniref:NAD(P)/FAD-dependent oxidoreductase n=1 Tax=Limisalsivibrio acetivorans TaxID=1304888 RepID=UPI0003B5BBF4|nr:FAD-dependent oxidoreductase [Limisalsivibrio acetivorans]
MRIVTVGTGMAATEFVSTLREEGSRDEVLMITPERFAPYSPCSMPFFLAGEPLETVYWKGEDFFENHGTEALLGESVTEIDTTKQTLLTSGGRSIGYDKLFFSTGSKSWYPKPDMLEYVGVFGFKSLTDLTEIDSYIREQGCKRAVVFGGGFIGVDAALSLWHRGLDVTIVHRNNRLLSQMTDEEGGKFATAKIEEKTGISVKLKNVVEEVKDNAGQVKSVVLTDGTEIDTDLLIITVGVSPNSEALTGDDGGVSVDECLRYSSNVYCAGDVALTSHMVTGEQKIYATYPNARSQARNAALSIMYGDEAFEGSVNTNVLKKHIDFPIIAAGLFEGENCTYSDAEVFRRLYLKDGKIHGYQIVGDTLLSGYVYNLYISQTELNDDFLDAFMRNDNKYYYKMITGVIH